MPDSKTDDTPKPKTMIELLAAVAADARVCAEAAKRDQLDLAAAARFYDAIAELFERESAPRPASEIAEDIRQLGGLEAAVASSPAPSSPLGAAAPVKPLG